MYTEEERKASKIDTAKRFHLEREIDESGMSGLGRVAEGVVLPNGIVVFWWLRAPFSIQQYASVEDMVFIHGHGGKATTRIVWESEE